MLLRKQLNREIGRFGEDAAADYLHRNGYRILQRNYSCKAGEIDIIAEQNDSIVFIEVKTRSPRANLPPAEAVDDEKQRRICNAARYYLSGYSEPSPQRFDIVSILLTDADEVSSIHLEIDAFRS